MPTLLSGAMKPLLNLVSRYEGEKYIVLIDDEESTLRHKLSETLAAREHADRLLTVDFRSQQFCQINYDTVHYGQDVFTFTRMECRADDRHNRRRRQ